MHNTFPRAIQTFFSDIAAKAWKLGRAESCISASRFPYQPQIPARGNHKYHRRDGLVFDSDRSFFIPDRHHHLDLSNHHHLHPQRFSSAYKALLTPVHPASSTYTTLNNLPRRDRRSSWLLCIPQESPTSSPPAHRRRVRPCTRFRR